MLQSTLGVVWLGPLRHELVIAGSSVVNAAPATFADAACTRNGNDATAAMSVTSLTAVHRWRPAPSESLLFIPGPPSSGLTLCAQGGARTSSRSGKRRLPQSTPLPAAYYVPQARPFLTESRNRY